MKKKQITLPPKINIRATDFQVIHFHDPRAIRPDGSTGSEIILIYSLGSDGIIREYANGKWIPLPIDPSNASEKLQKNSG